ncbi:MAG: c-type cytochrome [Bacteroidetes bacterium]|nr:MAG: c-type cytochrome [Bacteroidota bacterium]
MKTNTIKWASLFASALLLAVACKREAPKNEESFKAPLLAQSAFDYESGTTHVFFFDRQGNRITINNDVAALGRVLFYEKFMSVNNAVSCGSCHKQENAFADPNRFSAGFAAGLGTRNAPPIFNLAGSGNFFWDSRANDLREMVLMPIRHNVEMGMEKIEMLETKLNKVPYYAELFNKAFGSSQVTTKGISEALTQFILSIRSENTLFEKIGIDALNAQEKQGFEVFSGLHCQTCHGPATAPYYNSASFNIGLEKNYTDKGMGERVSFPEAEGLFKAPPLRNLAVTAPYMHDGRFATLEEVVDHYNSGVVDHANVSPQLRIVDPNSGGWGNNNTSSPKLNQFGMPTLELTPDEKADLVAFLKALKDNKLLTDSKYSDPFNY